FGHAFEAAAGFSDRLLHGEAIGLGMALAFEFSARRGLISGQDAGRVIAHLAATGLPTHVRAVPGEWPGVDAMMDLISQDRRFSAAGSPSSCCAASDRLSSPAMSTPPRCAASWPKSLAADDDPGR